MEHNVFGSPITGETREERASKALSAESSDGKYDKAVQYLEKLRAQIGDNNMDHMTFWLLYNATGDRLTMSLAWTDVGIMRSPCPLIIENGQWGAFLQTHQGQSSIGAVCYEPHHHRKARCQFLFLFQYAGDRVRCQTEVRLPGHYDKSSVDKFPQIIMDNPYIATSSADVGYRSMVSIGRTDRVTLLEANMTLYDVLSLDYDEQESNSGPERM